MENRNHSCHSESISQIGKTTDSSTASLSRRSPMHRHRFHFCTLALPSAPFAFISYRFRRSIFRASSSGSRQTRISIAPITRFAAVYRAEDDWANRSWVALCERDDELPDRIVFASCTRFRPRASAPPRERKNCGSGLSKKLRRQVRRGSIRHSVGWERRERERERERGGRASANGRKNTSANRRQGESAEEGDIM